jgi:oligopeptide/dipeptide ABC transporter ATP-binding protein
VRVATELSVPVVGLAGKDGPQPILEGKGLSFRYRSDLPLALNNVDVQVFPYGIVALVGESGSGKSTLGKILAGLLRPTQGVLFYRGQPVRPQDGPTYHRYLRDVQWVQQDPYAAFNPMRKVGESLLAPLLRHRVARDRRQALEKAFHLLEQVGLTPPGTFLSRYPHQLSGGQLQRLAMARALTVDPQVLVADEAATMLDVSLRLEILGLMRRLGQERGLAYVFITHDFALTQAFASGHVGKVMYAGRVVEEGKVETIIHQPRHPYTRALVDAIPTGDPDLEEARRRRRLRLLPSLGQGVPSRGCPLYPRCPRRLDRCQEEEPSLMPLPEDAQHRLACHHPLPEGGEAG